MSIAQILDVANTAIENVPKLATGEVTPKTLLNRYQLTLQSFGLDKVRAKVYKAGSALKEQQEDREFQTKNIADTDYTMHTGQQGKEMLSQLGTPVFCDIKLKGEKETTDQYLQLIWVLTDVEIVNNIVKTKVAGRDGSVKEYISRDDYQVKIRGAISNTFSRAYPKESVLRLKQLCTIGTPLDVVSEYLQLFGIHSLVVENASFKQSEGKVNIQTFEISCVSDEPFLLTKRK